MFSFIKTNIFYFTAQQTINDKFSSFSYFFLPEIICAFLCSSNSRSALYDLEKKIIFSKKRAVEKMSNIGLTIFGDVPRLQGMYYLRKLCEDKRN